MSTVYGPGQELPPAHTKQIRTDKGRIERGVANKPRMATAGPGFFLSTRHVLRLWTGILRSVEMGLLSLSNSPSSEDPAEPAFQMEAPKDGSSMAPRISFVTMSREMFEQGSNYSVSFRN